MSGASYILDSGARIVGVHSPVACAGYGCPIHHPSDHPYKDWKTTWIKDPTVKGQDGFVGRIDPTNKTFIVRDPDDVAYHLGEPNRLSIEDEGAFDVLIERELERASDETYRAYIESMEGDESSDSEIMQTLLRGTNAIRNAERYVVKRTLLRMAESDDLEDRCIAAEGTG